MITLYRHAVGNRSYRKVVAYMEDHSTEYTIYNLSHEELTREQLFEMLANTENGVEDILSTRSKAYKKLTDEGVDFDDMSLTRLLDYINNYNELLRYPIMVKDGATIVGYSDDTISLLRSREDRMREHNEFLNVAREIDKVHFLKMRDDYKEAAV
ncbi:ArsC/Spx/MgsR family protein [Sporosarcina sp. FSL W7-1283]|uniref:ArsC/Spx/MgsR family protein n=1 Tax=Sporosarcina sp. FSL W7-1283 TaxID=2921560 RepID=UPI0030FB0A9A